MTAISTALEPFWIALFKPEVFLFYQDCREMDASRRLLAIAAMAVIQVAGSAVGLVSNCSARAPTSELFWRHLRST
ncbi:MAG: hypothetical protein AAFQ64_06660 [Pseudomonadota bacterium]